MIKLTKLQQFTLSKEYLFKRLEKHIERGFVHYTNFSCKQIPKLKEWGVIVYNDKKHRYEIDIDIYNRLKRALDDTN